MQIPTMTLTLVTTGVILLWCSALVHPQTDCSIDLALVVDKSGSINNIDGGWNDIINFVIKVVDMLVDRSSNSRVALVVFNDKPKTVFEFTAPGDDGMMEKLVNLRDNEGPTGWTNSSGALYATRQLFEGADKGNQADVVAFITDGKPSKGFSVDGKLQQVDDRDITISGNSTRTILFNQVMEQSAKLKDMEIKLVSVGLTKAVSAPLLDMISDEVFLIESTSELMDEIVDIIDESCRVREDKTSPAATTTTTDDATTTTTSTNTPPAFTGECIVDVVLVIDSSGSITKGEGNMLNWDKVKNFTVDLVESLGEIGEDATQVSLILYSYRIKTEFELGELGREDMLDRIRNLPHLDSWTATAAALEQARQNILAKAANRKNVKDIIIVITDGRPTVFKNGTTSNEDKENLAMELVEEAALVKSQDISIVVVGLTNAVDEELLKTIADTDDDFMMVDDFDQLGDTQVGKLRDRTCARTITTTTTAMDTTTMKTLMTTPMTTTAGPLPSACTIDLIILVDASGSIGRANWNNVIDFVTNFLNTLLDLQQSNFNAAVICFSDRIDVALPFGEANEDSVRNAMDGLRYKGSYTATAEALQTAITLFQNETNDAGNPDYLVLLTDGFPSQKLNRSEKLEASEVINNPAKKEKFYDETRLLARFLKEDLGVTVVGIAVGDKTDEELLKELVSNPENDYFKAEEFADLSTDEFTRQLQNRTCAVLDPIRSACRVDVAMVVDNSGSVSEADIISIKDFLKRAVDLLFAKDPFVHFSLVLFANEATLKFNLGESTVQQMKDRIDKISKTQGFTASAAALDLVYNLVFNGSDRADADNVLIYITDGQPTKTLDKTLIVETAPPEQRKVVNDEVVKVADDLRISGVTVMSVGVTSEVNYTQLEKISDTEVFNVTQFNLLNDQLNDIIDATCQIGQTTACSIDIAIVVDSSGSIGPANWEIVKTFLQNLVLSFGEVGITGTKIAVINYSNTVELVFNLGTEDLKGVERVTELIADLEYKDSWTRTSQALDVVQTKVFNVSNKGDRSGVPNVVLLITDGRPSVSEDGSFRVGDNDQSEEAEQIRQLIEEEMIMKAQELKDKEVRIVALGITDIVKEEVMKMVVTDEDNDYFFVADFDSLRRVRSRLRTAVCDQ